MNGVHEVTRSFANGKHVEAIGQRPIIVLLLFQIVWSVATPFSARGDFSGPYILSPPDPGDYFYTGGAGPRLFGGWTFVAGGSGDRINTSGAPGTVVLDTTLYGIGVSGLLYSRAAASGTVSFDYTISGQGPGYVTWFDNPGAFPTYPTSGETNFISTPTHASFTVQGGDYIEFLVEGRGLVFSPAQRTLTITDFSAPVVPEPSGVVLLAAGFTLIVYRRRTVAVADHGAGLMKKPQRAKQSL